MRAAQAAALARHARRSAAELYARPLVQPTDGNTVEAWKRYAQNDAARTSAGHALELLALMLEAEDARKRARARARRRMAAVAAAAEVSR